MKSTHILIISTALLLSYSGFASTELALGATVPKADAKMLDISGESVTLSEAAGKKGLLVIFSCNTCPYVIASEKRYLGISAICQANEVGLVLVNSNEGKREGDDSIEEMKAHAKEYGYNFNYTVDRNSEVATAFGATRTPHVFLFDGDSKLVYRGAIDDSVIEPEKVEKQYLADAIKAMAAGEKIVTAETKSIGCGIKWKK